MSFPEQFRKWHGPDITSTPTPSPMFADSAAPIAEGIGRRVAVERSEHQVLEDVLAELRLANARAGAGEHHSSATIKTSARGVDLEVHSYADGLLSDAVGDALAQYARGMRELAALQARNWQLTAESVMP